MSDRTPSSFDLALQDEIKDADARLEKLSCIIMITVVMACYLLFMLVMPTKVPHLRERLTILVAVVVAVFGSSALIIHYFRFLEPMKWINTFMQVSLVTAAIGIDYSASGAVFALTSAPPYFYPFIISLTAFRLQPSLTFFAAAMAVAEYLGLYFFALYPNLPAESREAISPLGIPVTMMRVVLFAGVGLTCGIAAGYLKRLVKKKVQQEVRNADLQRMFGRYVSPEVAKEIMSSGDVLKPRNVEAVIMFGDLRGFTSYSEGREPGAVAAILNRYFDVVCRVIESEGGIVNKFIGDGFLAFFGVLIEQGSPSEAAIRATLRLEVELAAVLKPEKLTVGVALHSGAVIAGEIGSTGRCEFTVIGETVNITSRLEGLNRPLGTSRLASSEITRTVTGSPYQFKPHGNHQLKGVGEPFAVYELLSPNLN